jgi:hypothetical protein
MAVPNTFASATSAIPLANLDANFTYYDTAYSITGTTVAFAGNITVTGTSTLTGVATLTANPVLSAGTANGVTYLNGSKSLTSGTGLVFDGTNLGVGVTPSAWTRGPAFELKGTTVTYINSPSAQALSINSNNYFGSGGNIYNATGYATQYAQYLGQHIWYTAPSGTAGASIASFTQAMTLDASGNLGIGTTSPQVSLKVTSGATGTVSIQSTGTSGVYPSSGAGIELVAGSASATDSILSYDRTGSAYRNLVTDSLTLQLKTAGSEKMRIDSSGNVGIGTSSPVRRLSLNEAASTQVWTGYSQAGTEKFVVGLDASGNPSLYGTQNAPMLFYSNNTERMRIDSSGNLLMGTTSTSVTSGGYNFLINDGGTGYSTGYIGHITGCPSGYAYLSFKYAGTAIGTITQNGTTGVLYNLTSDYRLKNNAVALTGAKDFVMALQPKKWQWWDGSGEGVGFIAHEFMEVAKYSGNGKKDAVDSDGKPVYQSIQPSSSEVMANLVSFIQEQQALITALTARITALESK